MPTQFYTLYLIMSSFAFQSQLFEQCQRDINHTKAIDVVKLARVLGCKTKDLLQI